MKTLWNRMASLLCFVSLALMNAPTTGTAKAASKPAASSQDPDCSDVVCVCHLQWDAQSNNPSPDACFDHADFSWGTTAANGCCQMSTCTVKACFYTVAVVAVAKPGMTCSFTIFQGGTRVGTCATPPTPPNPCQSASWSSGTLSLNCGETQSFSVKIGSTAQASRAVDCKDCGS